MEKSFYLILVLLSLCLFDNSYSQRYLSLDDAITIARNQNTNVVKSSNSISTFQSNLKSAYGNLLPSLNVNGGFGWQRAIRNNGQIEFDSLDNQISDGSFGNDSRNWSLSAGGGVTLFNGLSNIAAINQSKANLESAKLTLEKLKQTVTLQTITYYTQIISYQKLFSFQEENLKYNEGLLAQIKEKFDLKIVPISDVYAQEAQTANARVSYLQAKNDLETAKINLLNYLTIDVSQDYQFDSTAKGISDTSLFNDNIQALYEFALSSRADYQSLIYTVEASQSQLTIARSGLFPSLSASYGFSTSANTPSNLFNQRSYNLGLSLNIPIFSNWNTENSIQAADIQLQNINEDLKALELSIKSQVKTANLNLQTAKQQLEASEVALNSSKERWKIAAETYNLGASTYLDLQLSYNNYLQAQYNKISNEFSCIVAQYNLLNALGKI